MMITTGQALAAAAVAAHASLAVITAAHALLHVRDPRAAWGWIAACWLAPLAGPLLYLMLGTNRVRARARELLGTDDLAALETEPVGLQPQLPGVLEVELRELVRIGGAMTRRPLLAGNTAQILHDGEQTYPAMIAAIDAAQQRVWMSSYIFSAGAVGQRFADALAAAQARGVEVRVLIDGVGNLYYWPRGSRMLAKRGLDVRRFQLPRRMKLVPYMNLRNHRKLLIVDDGVAFTGGLNIGDQHMVTLAEHPAADLHFRFEGPIARQLAQSFAEDWAISGGDALTLPAKREVSMSTHGTNFCRVITEGPNEELDRLELILLGALATAHRSVRIMTPYFIPTPELARAMEAAALRGVEVLVMLPARSNLPWVDWASRHWLRSLLQRNVRVLLRPAPFAHSKLFIVDGYYTLVGSANLDPRSLMLNFELLVETYGAAFTATLNAHFDQQRAGCVELTLAELDTDSRLKRLRNSICWLFSPYL
jgi:cardiolipin synthase